MPVTARTKKISVVSVWQDDFCAAASTSAQLVHSDHAAGLDNLHSKLVFATSGARNYQHKCRNPKWFHSSTCLAFSRCTDEANDTPSIQSSTQSYNSDHENNRCPASRKLYGSGCIGGITCKRRRIPFHRSTLITFRKSPNLPPITADDAADSTNFRMINRQKARAAGIQITL
jgi:hypothetical protein